mgnify:CR=1 FL=1
MKKYIFIIFLFCLSTQAQEIEWISFEKAIELNKKNPKTILIDVYTDWCGYCKKMDHITYENPVIATIINNNYYAVKLDAEQTTPILYKGKEYKFIKQGKKGYNELAANILHGEMSYPSTVFMDQDERLIQKLPGYLDPKEMEPILLYFAQQNFLTVSWETFKEEFVSNL